MKTCWIVLGSIILLFLTSSYPMGSRDNKIGSQAPDFAIASQHGTIETPALRGKTLVVTFWRSADAQSRIDNIQYQRAVANSDNGDIQFISVNLDDDAELARSIADVDGIPADQLFNANDATLGDIVKDYNQQQRCDTYMINADGVVSAINPSLASI